MSAKSRAGRRRMGFPPAKETDGSAWSGQTTPASAPAAMPCAVVRGSERRLYSRALSRRPSRAARPPEPITGAAMPRFTGVDFYEIDSLLQEDEIQIRDHVRDWVEERYLPLVEDAYEKAHFP